MRGGSFSHGTYDKKGFRKHWIKDKKVEEEAWLVAVRACIDGAYVRVGDRRL